MLRRIKLCLGVLSFVWGAMTLVLVFILHGQTMDARNLFNNRVLALQLADELRQSSDDLTRFARSYAATGQPKFLAHFQDVLDIRNGVVLRPVGYEFAYWNLDISEDRGVAGQDKRKSIEQRFLDLGITAIMGQFLVEAKRESDELAKLEKRAFAMVKAGQMGTAMQILYSDSYDQSKSMIMKQIREFQVILDMETSKILKQAIAKTETTTQFLIGFLLLSLCCGLFAFTLLPPPTVR